MTEEEYIIVTNRVSISHSIKAMSEVVPGDSYGVDEDELQKIRFTLARMEIALFGILNTEKT